MRYIIMACCGIGIAGSIATHNLATGCFALVGLLANLQLQMEGR